MQSLLFISWNKPWMGSLFLLIIGLVYLLWHLQSWRRKIRNEFADDELNQEIFGNQESRWLNIKSIMLICSLCCIVLALMQPMWGEEEQTMKREGIDLVFALDLSNSMNAQDVAPSRLEKAKMFIQKYIETLGGDRVGFVVFAGEAYAVSPLTSDYSALDGYIKTFDTNLLWNQGTNLSDAVTESVNLFQQSSNTSKAVILISDGEDHEEGINKAIQYAKDNQVEIFTIGVGTSKPTPIPMIDANGWDIGYKEDDNGNVVLTNFQGDELIDIAQKTNGTYTLMTSVEETISTVIEQVNHLQKKAESEMTTFNKKHQYQW